MRLNWKLAPLAMLLAVALCGSGCSGINTGAGISPATFLLPGLGQTQPQETTQQPRETVAAVGSAHTQTY